MTPVAVTAALVVNATGGRLVSGDLTTVFDGVSTDTRALVPGALFVALKGDRFDAHAFLPQALAGGVAGLLVSEAPEDGAHATVIVVPDTLVALQALARAIRRASGACVVAITGSAGKTTTKEVTADLLETRYRVFRNRGNLNNHIGLPLSLIELRHGPDVAVVELGMNHAGEIRTLVGIAEPNVRVWTNVGDAHIGYFGSRDAVAAAKAEILELPVPGTVVVANADDPLVMRHVRASSLRARTFGEAPDADVRATDVIDRGFDGTSAEVETSAGPLHLEVPLPGRAHLQNVLAAVAVAVELDVDRALIRSRVASLRPVARRGATVRLSNGTRVVDDSYNASPAAVLAAIATLAATQVDGRRIFVLGDMLELGGQSQTLHRACGEAAADAGIDLLITIGGADADAAARGAIERGLSPDRVHRFADSVSAAPAVAALVRPGDLVVIKGSRGTRTDLVADRLREVA
ncbi:MAG: UDP-N-acetylmuramoyl-tripeptide--D-alanyl-D-alanine ligase [Acidobacteriota bacterium]